MDDITNNTVLPPDLPVDPTSVYLDDIIDNILVDALSEDSYMHNIKKYHAILIAKRLLQDLNYDALKELRVFETTITPANKVIPPEDFVDYVRLSLVNDEGKLIPIFVNKNINISSIYIEDELDDIITDNNRYQILAQGTRRTNYSSPDCRTYSFQPGIKGGISSYTGDYRYDRENREFILDNIPSGFDNVVIEYLSDPIIAEKDTTQLRIHKYMQSAIETGIYYKYIDKLRNVPASEKARARHEFYEEVRKGRRRLNTKPQEIIQKLSSDIGLNKMLR